MSWRLEFSNRREARILDAQGRPITGYLDWLTAQDIVSAHNIVNPGKEPEPKEISKCPTTA
jgi:hypothetical protein